MADRECAHTASTVSKLSDDAKRVEANVAKQGWVPTAPTPGLSDGPTADGEGEEEK